jgi:hypothetical protein
VPVGLANGRTSSCTLLGPGLRLTRPLKVAVKYHHKTVARRNIFCDAGE